MVPQPPVIKSSTEPFRFVAQRSATGWITPLNTWLGFHSITLRLKAQSVELPFNLRNSISEPVISNHAPGPKSFRIFPWRSKHFWFMKNFYICINGGKCLCMPHWQKYHVEGGFNYLAWHGQCVTGGCIASFDPLLPVMKTSSVMLQWIWIKSFFKFAPIAAECA